MLLLLSRIRTDEFESNKDKIVWYTIYSRTKKIIKNTVSVKRVYQKQMGIYKLIRLNWYTSPNSRKRLDLWKRFIINPKPSDGKNKIPLRRLIPISLISFVSKNKGSDKIHIDKTVKLVIAHSNVNLRLKISSNAIWCSCWGKIKHTYTYSHGDAK